MSIIVFIHINTNTNNQQSTNWNDKMEESSPLDAPVLAVATLLTYLKKKEHKNKIVMNDEMSQQQLPLVGPKK